MCTFELLVDFHRTRERLNLSGLNGGMSQRAELFKLIQSLIQQSFVARISIQKMFTEREFQVFSVVIIVPILSWQLFLKTAEFPPVFQTIAHFPFCSEIQRY
jgi:hypothetical protein